MSSVSKILEITEREVLAAIEIAVKQVRRNLPEFTYKCQNHTSVNNFYPACENNQWTCGFWPGVVWLSYELTGDTSFSDTGYILVESFLNRIKNKIEVDHHDMGFLYNPSCVAAYLLTGNEDGCKAALLAADQLVSRFQEKGEFLQAWGAMDSGVNHRFIIDCLMNLPLLYWAAEQTGDEKYSIIAKKHTETCLKYSIREDGSTYHTVFMDKTTGEMIRGETCQGYGDDSFWARGQAWAIYGIAISYRYTRSLDCLEAFKKILPFYLSKLPVDMVPYWDMIFTSGNDEPRDSSSASIVACGLLEMAGLVSGNEAANYVSLAKQMIKSIVDHYSVKDNSISNGLVMHATYSKKSPYNTCTPEGVDECASWGDYFYLEALMRLSRDWKSYW